MSFSHVMGADVTQFVHCWQHVLQHVIRPCFEKNKLALILQVMAIINANTDILANS